MIMMALCPIPSQGQAGGIVPLLPQRRGLYPCGGVVGHVRQVDPEAHPYPSYLLLGPAGKPSLASPPPLAYRSGRWHV
jgi:hypothetical protein